MKGMKEMKGMKGMEGAEHSLSEQSWAVKGAETGAEEEGEEGVGAEFSSSSQAWEEWKGAETEFELETWMLDVRVVYRN